jgi:predicted DsbA family dithiol-disulfide isomerase
MQQHYKDRVQVEWIGYPLVHQPDEPRYFGAHQASEWDRAGLEEPDLTFTHWSSQEPMPRSSLPALATAMVAKRLGLDFWARVHLGLFRAFFTEQRDISQVGVLQEIARKAGMDPIQLAADLAHPPIWDEVLAGYRAARHKQILSVPTLKFGDGQGFARVDGEIDARKYRKLIDWYLST